MVAASLRFEVLIDYDSGAEKEVARIGPLLLRESRSRPSGIGELVMTNGARGLTGIPDWRIAMAFRGGSKVSPTFEATRVLGAARRLELLLQPVPLEEAQLLKYRLLMAIAVGGATAADRFIEDHEAALLHRCSESVPR
jgi:hypothetical protein